MKKYLIKWNVGYGDNHDVVEAISQAAAENEAYEMWRDEAESNAEYSAQELTRELAENYGFEDELE